MAEKIPAAAAAAAASAAAAPEAAAAEETAVLRAAVVAAAVVRNPYLKRKLQDHNQLHYEASASSSSTAASSSLPLSPSVVVSTTKAPSPLAAAALFRNPYAAAARLHHFRRDAAHAAVHQQAEPLDDAVPVIFGQEDEDSRAVSSGNSAAGDLLLPAIAVDGPSNSIDKNKVTATTTTNATALVIAASHKAGMDGIDRARIDAIILKESGNSKFMQQQYKRDERVNQKIEKLRAKLLKTTTKGTAKGTARNDHHDVAQDYWRTRLERDIDQNYIPEWRAQRPVRSVKVVVDMDMFYMACELLERPHLRHVPAVVGGPSMICTSNYTARQYGVRSAMPGYIGAALVDQLSNGTQKLHYCPMNFALYRTKSQIVREVLSEYDPHLSAYSLDEAYLDISHYLLLSLRHPHLSHADLTRQVQHGAAAGQDNRPTNTDETMTELLEFSPRACRDATEAIVHSMRRHVQSATGGLTCSAGVAANFMLAKIASDVNKPDGQLLVDPCSEAIDAFLHPRTVRKIGGIGRVTEKILQAFGIGTVAQLYEHRALVALLFDFPTTSTASILLKASVGCGGEGGASSDSAGPADESSESAHHQKGISRERSFTADESWTFINEKLESIATMLANDMAQKDDLVAGSVAVKVKLHTFDCLSKVRTLPHGTYVSTAAALSALAAELLREIKVKYEQSPSVGAGATTSTTTSANKPRFAVRLLGIRCSNLCRRHEVGRSPNHNNGKGGIIGSSVQKTLDDYAAAAVRDIAEQVEPNIIATGGHPAALNPYVVSPPRLNKQKKQPLSPSPERVFAAATSTTTAASPSPPQQQQQQLQQKELQLEPTGQQLPCPVCSRRFKDEAAVSRHLDLCLTINDDEGGGRQEVESSSSSAVVVAAKKNQLELRRKTKKTLVTDFFAAKR